MSETSSAHNADAYSIKQKDTGSLLPFLVQVKKSGEPSTQVPQGDAEEGISSADDSDVRESKYLWEATTITNNTNQPVVRLPDAPRANTPQAEGTIEELHDFFTKVPSLLDSHLDCEDSSGCSVTCLPKCLYFGLIKGDGCMYRSKSQWMGTLDLKTQHSEMNERTSLLNENYSALKSLSETYQSQGITCSLSGLNLQDNTARCILNVDRSNNAAEKSTLQNTALKQAGWSLTSLQALNLSSTSDAPDAACCGCCCYPEGGSLCSDNEEPSQLTNQAPTHQSIDRNPHTTISEML